MKITRFLISLILLISFTTGSLFAVEVAGTAYGSTYEEAKNNALLELNNYIFGNFVESSFSMEQIADDNKSETNSQNSLRVTAQTGLLVGVRYREEDITKKEKKKFGDYKITAYMDSSQARFYLDKLKEVYNILNLEYSDIATRSDSEKVRVYPLYIQKLEEYEMYRQVLFLLSSNIPEQYSINTSSNYVRSEYRNLLISSNNDLQGAYKKAQEANAIDDIKRIQEELNLRQAMESETIQLQLQKDKILAEQSIRNLEIEIGRITSISKSANDLVKDSSLSKEIYTRRIETAKRELVEAARNYDELVIQENNRYNNERKNEEMIIRNRAYYISEMDGLGNPTPAILSLRQQEVDYKMAELKENHQHRMDIINDGFLAFLQERYDTLMGLVEDYDGYEFLVRKDVVDSWNVRYDGNNAKWQISLSVSGLNAIVDLPYKDITGEKAISPVLPSSKDYKAYIDYNFNVEAWTRKLQSSDFFQIYYSGKNIINWTSGEISIGECSLNLIRKDNGKKYKGSTNSIGVYTSYDVSLPDSVNDLFSAGRLKMSIKQKKEIQGTGTKKLVKTEGNRVIPIANRNLEYIDKYEVSFAFDMAGGVRFDSDDQTHYMGALGIPFDFTYNIDKNNGVSLLVEPFIYGKCLYIPTEEYSGRDEYDSPGTAEAAAIRAGIRYRFKLDYNPFATVISIFRNFEAGLGAGLDPSGMKGLYLESFMRFGGLKIYNETKESIFCGGRFIYNGFWIVTFFGGFQFK